jgi:hypothetical protein
MSDRASQLATIRECMIGSLILITVHSFITPKGKCSLQYTTLAYLNVSVQLLV